MDQVLCLHCHHKLHIYIPGVDIKYEFEGLDIFNGTILNISLYSYDSNLDI